MRFWKSKGGTVIAVDQDNRPALVANTVGSGKTLLSAYPIRKLSGELPAAFDKPENTHRIYQAFREWSGVKPLFRRTSHRSRLSCPERRKLARLRRRDESQCCNTETVTITAAKPLHIRLRESDRKGDAGAGLWRNFQDRYRRLRRVPYSSGSSHRRRKIGRGEQLIAGSRYRWNQDSRRDGG